MRSPEEIPYIWDLVFRMSSRKELRSLCQVSKLFNDLATPILYRSVVLRKSRTTNESWPVLPNVDDPAKIKNKSSRLLYRLVHVENIRARVRELTLVKTRNKADGLAVRQSLEHPEDPWACLVTKMPNLTDVYSYDVFPLTEGFLDALKEHPNSPRLHVFRYYYRKKEMSTLMPFVRTLHMRVHHEIPSWRRDPPSHDAILHDVFATCPHLEDLCLSTSRRKHNCFMGGPYQYFQRQIFKYLSPKTTSDPSQTSLVLNGYVIGNEAPFWRDTFPWHNLRSLSLGPDDDSPGFLETVGGYIQNLTSFTITRFCTDEAMIHTGLDSFLSSFHTLERLTAKGYVPSVDAVAHHPNLKHLCLHAIEHPKRERPVLSVTEMKLLDNSCPYINTLEIDINTDGTWPGPFINSLAMGFTNLRHLSIHVELGSRHMELEWQLIKQLGRQLYREAKQHYPEQFPDFNSDPDSDSHVDDITFEDYSEYRSEWQDSVLTEKKAQDFGNQFFGRRPEPSNVEKITLRTGEKLRRFIGRRGADSFEEDEYERIFELCPPRKKGDEPVLTRLESERERRIRKINEEGDLVRKNRRM